MMASDDTLSILKALGASVPYPGWLLGVLVGAVPWAIAATAWRVLT
jgi:hypothetical protein